MTETLTIRLPKSLARDFRAKTRAAKTNPTAVLRRAAAEFVKAKSASSRNAMQEHIRARAGHLEWLLFRRSVVAKDTAMILVDTSVIVAWLDPEHQHHKACTNALDDWAARDTLAVSSISYAELAAGARTRESVDEALKGFEMLELDFASAWRAGMAFRQYRSSKEGKPVLPDFFIRAQAAVLNLPHLTNDRRRIKAFSDVDFEFVT